MYRLVDRKYIYSLQTKILRHVALKAASSTTRCRRGRASRAMPAPPCRTHSSHVSSQKSVRPIPNLQCIAHVHAAAAHRQLSLVYLARRCLASEKANRNCQSQPTEASLPHISWPATSRPALQLAGSPPRTRLHIPTRDPHPRPARLSAHHPVPTRLCEIHLISTSAPPVSSAPLLLTLSTPGAPLAPCTAYMRHPEAKLLDQHACPMRCAALGAQTSPFRHRCYYYTNESNGAW